MRSGGSTYCVVMACADKGEADAISKLLLQQNTECIVTYRRAEDILQHQPLGRVALVILSSWETSAKLGRIIRWLKHRWPRCPVTVLGSEGGGEDEMAARQGGALYLTRPVHPEQWTDLLEHVLRPATAMPIPNGADADLASKPSHH